MVSIITCLKCNLTINEASERYIKCDGCHRPIHVLNCSELTGAEIKSLELRPSTKRRIKFICLDCEQGVHQIPKLINMINDLREEVRNLRDNCTLGITTTQELPLSVTEDIINEITERNSRSRNIIIFGSTETGTNKLEQTEQDKQLVNNIFSELNLSQDNIKPSRLGKFDATKLVRSRPIKVTLTASEDVLTAVRKFSKIKSTNKFPGLFLSTDKTPKQIAYYKMVKSELNMRLEKGESNLRIQYRNGTPKIVSSEN